MTSTGRFTLSRPFTITVKGESTTSIMGGSMRRAAIVKLFLVALIAIAAVIRLPAETSAQDEPCGGKVIIANGGFEDPPAPFGGGIEAVPTSWTAIGSTIVSGPNAGISSQSVVLDTGLTEATMTLTQSLSQAELPGSTVTFTITALRAGTMSFAGQSQSFAGPGHSWVITTLTFVVPIDAMLPLDLTFSRTHVDPLGTRAEIDSITGTYSKPCPTATATS